MARLKKILISLPDSLLDELDAMVDSQQVNRSELIREAMRFYLKEKKRVEMSARMKKGYEEMAEINLEIANAWLAADTFMALGDELDAALTKTLRENSRLSVTQAAILAALEYADMYKKAEVSADNLRGQIKEYLEDSARSKMDAEIAKREVERLTRELQNAQAKLGG